MADFGLLDGFQAALSLQNLFYATLGCLLGTLVGVLPGLGPAPALAILLPLTIYAPPTSGMIMLLAIPYGAMYGGSTTSIVINIPGEVASVVTCIDGYQMARQGRAGPALAVSAVGSWIAGTLGVLALGVAGPFLAEAVFKFGAPEYFSLMAFSMTAVGSLSGHSIIKGLMTALVGFSVAFVGLDIATGIPRFTGGNITLMGGIELIPLIVGLFGIAEIFNGMDEGIVQVSAIKKLGRLLPGRDEFVRSFWAMLRGTTVGFFAGLLPGIVPAVTGFLAYDLERRISKTPDRFGKGAIEGVAAPEAANNATAQAGLIPMFVFGIPTSGVAAILLGALMIYGLQPGPLLFTEHADFVWTIIASMYIGNTILLILNLPLVGIWARLCVLPYRFLSLVVLAVCIVGAYSSRNSLFDISVALLFGFVGYFMKKYDWPAAPMTLGIVLGPMMEKTFRQSLAIAGGDLGIFLRRPVAAAFLILAVLLALMTAYIRLYKSSRGPRSQF